MGLMLCRVCYKQLPLPSEGEHVCDPEVIIARYEAMHKQATDAKRKCAEMEDAVQVIVSTLPSLEGDEVTIKTAVLQQLWDAVDAQWFNAKTMGRFHQQWLATHLVLCEAYDVFRGKRFGKPITLLEGLKALYDACLDSQKVLGYTDSGFVLTPEQLIGETSANG